MYFLAYIIISTGIRSRYTHHYSSLYDIHAWDGKMIIGLNHSQGQLASSRTLLPLFMLLILYMHYHSIAELHRLDGLEGAEKQLSGMLAMKAGGNSRERAVYVQSVLWNTLLLVTYTYTTVGL